MACCDLLLVWYRCLQSSAKCKYTHYRSTYCLGLRGADIKIWDCDPAIHEFGLTGEALNSRSRILTPNWREITGVYCIHLKDCQHARVMSLLHSAIDLWPVVCFLQHIDGEAFLLLSQADIVKIMGVKLGPALKIFNSVLMFKNTMEV